jgi:hypothetical protein
MAQGMMGRLMKDGWTEGLTDGRTDRKKERKKERRTDEQTERKKERKKDGRTDERRALSSHGYSTLPQRLRCGIQSSARKAEFCYI